LWNTICRCWITCLILSVAYTEFLEPTALLPCLSPFVKVNHKDIPNYSLPTTDNTKCLNFLPRYQHLPWWVCPNWKSPISWRILNLQSIWISYWRRNQKNESLWVSTHGQNNGKISTWDYEWPIHGFWNFGNVRREWNWKDNVHSNACWKTCSWRPLMYASILYPILECNLSDVFWWIPGEVPVLNVSYKPQKISPKSVGTVRQLLHEKIRDAYVHPQVC